MLRYLFICFAVYSSLASARLSQDRIQEAQEFIPQFREVTSSVFAGATPGRWQTDATCPVEVMAALGFKTNLNLRNWRDDVRALVKARQKVVLGPHSLAGEREACRDLGIECVHLPLSSSRYPSQSDREKIQEALFILEQATPEDPAYVHCEYGIDRTGLIIALYRVQSQGWSPEDAYHEWVASGHKGVRRFATKRLDHFFFSITGYNPKAPAFEVACDRSLVAERDEFIRQ